MNPNIMALQENIPKCPICLGCLVNPVMINLCSHIFCELCITMWLQKKESCPLCRKKLDKITKIYFPNNSNKKNNKHNYLFYSIENLKLDNYDKFTEKCLICGEEQPKDELILCHCRGYFYSHFKCDPPMGLYHGKFYCRFCRRKFIESIKFK